MNIFLRMEELVKGQPLDKLYQITGAEFVEAVDAWYVMKNKADIIRNFYQTKYEGVASVPAAYTPVTISTEPEEGTGQSVSQTLLDAPASEEIDHTSNFQN